jgi:hypothetical protein
MAFVEFISIEAAAAMMAMIEFRSSQPIHLGKRHSVCYATPNANPFHTLPKEAPQQDHHGDFPGARGTFERRGYTGRSLAGMGGGGPMGVSRPGMNMGGDLRGRGSFGAAGHSNSKTVPLYDTDRPFGAALPNVLPRRTTRFGGPKPHMPLHDVTIFETASFSDRGSMMPMSGGPSMREREGMMGGGMGGMGSMGENMELGMGGLGDTRLRLRTIPAMHGRSMEGNALNRMGSKTGTAGINMRMAGMGGAELEGSAFNRMGTEIGIGGIGTRMGGIGDLGGADIEPSRFNNIGSNMGMRGIDMRIGGMGDMGGSGMVGSGLHTMHSNTAIGGVGTRIGGLGGIGGADLERRGFNRMGRNMEMGEMRDMLGPYMEGNGFYG